MEHTTNCNNNDSRAVTRRTQILEAAQECFQTHGFHNASIARISKAAGMSPGHIYHYFENKEAIIAAIVDRDLECVMESVTSMRNAEDPLEALVAAIERVAEKHLNRTASALNLEILAEAARNPKIAEMVYNADQKIRACVIDATYAMLEKRNKQKSADEITSICEFIATIFEGLSMRGILNPHLNRRHLVCLMRNVVRYIIDSDGACTQEYPQ